MSLTSNVRRLKRNILDRPGRATGPRTSAGLARSSLNAVRHGLGAVQAVLPGEDAAEYTRRMESTFEALAPANELEAQLAALVGDDLWRLERLGRVEQGISLARIEELAAQVEDGIPRIAEVIHGVGTALNGWVAAPAPRERGEELSRRVQAVRKVLALVMEVLPDFQLDGVAEVERLLLMTGDRVAHLELPPDFPERVREALRGVLVDLLSRGEVEQKRQDEIRKAVATIALPGESELKKLTRYRRQLEDGLQRRLQALETMRLLTANRPGPEDADKAREFRLRLRLVT